MPCDTSQDLTPAKRQRMTDAVERLNKALGNNEVTLVIGAAGSIAFKGWNEREGVADLCAFRRLAASNSANLRRAIMRAEAVSGKTINQRAIINGVHSHDGGKTWGTH